MYRAVKSAMVGMVFRLLPEPVNKQIVNFISLASKRGYGQYQTISRRECVDREGKKIPWYTYPAIEFLAGIDFSQQRIFEYGSGNSSAFWSGRALSVTSVEHDREWYEKTKSCLLGNQKIELCDTEDSYINSIHTATEKFDVIVIDGKYREQCAMQIEQHLTENGIVILDNSDWFKNTARYLREDLDLLEVDFHGFGPINAYTWTTSIFFSRKTRLKPINGIQPLYSASAIQNDIYEKSNR
jgi:hypothetical protein